MQVKEGECILYLWQNQRTVVIGKNQNAWKECKIFTLEQDGGHLVRRLSGGGAVYHDLGNLNFTFCVKKSDYNVDKQLDVILEAVKLLGIKAEKTGRNDITVEGKKFSGNAFLSIDEHCYHHGTLMVNVNASDMMKYLNVDIEKLKSKGVDSVRSRVVSLVAFNPDITVDKLVNALVQAFSKVYGMNPVQMKESDLPQDEIAKLKEKFESWDWKYGRKIPFNHAFSSRFPWGNLDVQIEVNEGIIRGINIFSDAMEQDSIQLMQASLEGCKYDLSEIKHMLDDVFIWNFENEEAVHQIKDDFIDLFSHNM